MSQSKVLSALIVAASVALAGSAYAQTGSGNSTSPTTNPDSSAPLGSPGNPAAGTGTDSSGKIQSNDTGVSNVDGKTTNPTAKKHKKKKKSSSPGEGSSSGASPSADGGSASPQ